MEQLPLPNHTIETLTSTEKVENELITNYLNTPEDQITHSTTYTRELQNSENHINKKSIIAAYREITRNPQTEEINKATELNPFAPIFTPNLKLRITTHPFLPLPTPPHRRTILTRQQAIRYRPPTKEIRDKRYIYQILPSHVNTITTNYKFQILPSQWLPKCKSQTDRTHNQNN